MNPISVDIIDELAWLGYRKANIDSAAIQPIIFPFKFEVQNRFSSSIEKQLHNCLTSYHIWNNLMNYGKVLLSDSCCRNSMSYDKHTMRNKGIILHVLNWAHYETYSILNRCGVHCFDIRITQLIFKSTESYMLRWLMIRTYSPYRKKRFLLYSNEVVQVHLLGHTYQMIKGRSYHAKFNPK